MAGEWNHNIHYHSIILHSVPPGCRLALEVGSGIGDLTSKLADRCAGVIGIDVDRKMIQARFRNRDARVQFLAGDIMQHPFASASFDFIAAVAVLHHLPLRPALERLRDLLKPGGVLAVVGLYRAQTIADYAIDSVAVPASWIMRMRRGYFEPPTCKVMPRETLAELKHACGEVLPGASIQRLLLFRYFLTWRKPGVLAE